MGDGLMVEADRNVHTCTWFQDGRPFGRDQFPLSGDDVDDLLLGGVDVTLGGRAGREYRVADGQILGTVDLRSDVVDPIPPR